MSPQRCHTSEPVRSVAARLEPAVEAEHDARAAASSASTTIRRRPAPVVRARSTPAPYARPRVDAGSGRGRRGPYPVLVYRLSSHADPAFLAEMLYEAVNWRDDGAEERPPLEELLAQPIMRRYVEGWGRVDDVALVALDRLDEPVGAAWYRRFTADEPGFGFVAPDVPELSIAVYPECRGRHVGGLLLGSLIIRARADGHRVDQPERGPGESGAPALRAPRLRGPRTAGRGRDRRSR